MAEMANYPMYRLKKILIKIPLAFSVEMEKLILKFIQNHKGS